jgi:hypothetical protein
MMWHPISSAWMMLKSSRGLAQSNSTFGADFASFSNLYPAADRWILAADRNGAITRTHNAKSYTETGIDTLPELISKHRQLGS